MCRLFKPLSSFKYLSNWSSTYCIIGLKLKQRKKLTMLKSKNTYALMANDYALVICNHGPPTPGAGRGIAVEMSGVFTFALSPQCGGNTRDLCYIGKKGGAMKT